MISSSSFRGDIQGMRAVAILLVVLFHSGVTALPGGFIGVDVFFVISGYLITGILLKEQGQSGIINLTGFYAKRVKRLLPASFVMITVVILLSSFLLSPLEQRTIAKSGAATALYSSNVWFTLQAGDYFADSSALNPFLHTWSLAVEEQFYLLWPIFLIMGKRSPKATITVVSALSFLVCLFLMHNHEVWAFYASPARAWEFGVGALSCTVPPPILQRIRPFLTPIAAVGATLVVGTALLLQETMPFPGFTAVPAAVGTAAVLLAGELGNNPISRLLQFRLMQRIGDLSYSWYLWHWPVLVFIALTVPNISPSARLLAGMASIIPAALSMVLVENVARRSPTLARRPGLALIMAAGLTFAGVIGAGASHFEAATELGLPAQKAIASARDTKTISAINNCQSNYDSEVVQKCEFGVRNGTLVVLFGDSHAAHWSSALAHIAKERRWTLVSIVKSNCPVARVPAIYHEVSRKVLVACPIWREAALKQIVAMKPALVILASASTYVPRSGNPTLISPISEADWSRDLASTLRLFSSQGIQPVVIRDIPSFPFDVPTCLSREARRSAHPERACAIARTNAVNARMISAENAGLKSVPEARLIDLTSEFCAVTCLPVQRGIPAYRDDSHVSVAYANALIPKLDKALLLRN